MAEAAHSPDIATAVVSSLDTIVAAFEAGFASRMAQMGNLAQDLDDIQARFAGHGQSFVLLALLGAGAAILTHLLLRAFSAMLARRTRPEAGSRGFAVLASALLSVLAMLVITRLAIDDAMSRTTVQAWVLAAALFFVARAGLRSLLPVPRDHDQRADAAAVNAFVQCLSAVVGLALFAIALFSALRIFSAGPGLSDVVRLVILVPLTVLLVTCYRRHRHTVSALILAPHPDSGFRQKLASAWPWVAVVVTLLTIVGSQAAMTIGHPLPPLATFTTLMLVLLAPHLDTLAAHWAERGLETPNISLLVVAWRRTFRFVIVGAIFSLLGYFWVTPVLIAMGLEAPTIAAHTAELAFILVISVWLWNATGAFAGRVALSEFGAGTAHEAGEVPRSRLATVLPLIVATSKAAIVSMAALTMMVSIGINVLPILGGLSVFGLAIGFGSQTLVKDIVAGLFFMTDDAFRFGEFIETSGAKGTVEKISIRSISLRNPGGAVATVPYGQIGKVTNYSREWVIVKYVFRVAFDTDVELVRKLFKKIGKDIEANPELSQDLLEPFKSQGIGMVEDGTLLIRGKFKARAGKQFPIQKAVLAAVHKAFIENGIIAVAKPLTVQR